MISDITSILEETPTKFELTNLLYDPDDKWYEFRLALHVHKDVLENLKQKIHVNMFVKVIDKWKDTQPSPDTWETVITAIGSPSVNNKAMADQIGQVQARVYSGVQTTSVKFIQFSFNKH